MKVDPPTEKIELPGDKPIVLSVPQGGIQRKVMFAGPYSPYVAVYDGTSIGAMGGVFDLRTDSGTKKLLLPMPLPARLSPDGRYLVAAGDFRRNPGDHVYDLKTGNPIVQLTSGRVPTMSAGNCWFPSADRVAVFEDRNNNGNSINVWTLPEGKPLRTVRTSSPIGSEIGRDGGFAFSPGGRYLADSDDETVRIHDLNDGHVAGELTGANRDRVMAVAFSPDGRELACVRGDSRQSRLEITSVETGSAATSLAIDDLARGRLASERLENGRGWVKSVPVSGLPSLQWFPNRTLLLLHGRFIVDRGAGDIVHDLGHARHLVLDDARLLAADVEGNMLVVKSVPVPNDAIRQASEILENGGRPTDIGLPPLTKAEFSGREISLSPPDGLPKRIELQTLRSAAAPVAVPLAAWPGDILFGGPQSARAVVYYRRTAVGALRPYDSRPAIPGARLHPADQTAPVRLETIDLTTGKVAARLDLPFECGILSIDPDAGFVVLQRAGSPGRLDVWSLAEGRHVAAARPFEESPKSLPSVVLVDGEHLLISHGKERSLWHLPEFRRLYRGTGPSARSVQVVHDRRTWLVHDFQRFVAWDVLSGEPRASQVAVSNRYAPDRCRVSPDGTWLLLVDFPDEYGGAYRLQNLGDGKATYGHPVVRKAPFHWCGNDHLVQFDSGDPSGPENPTRTERWEIVVTDPVRNIVVRGYELRDGYPIPGTLDGLVWYVCRAAEGSDVPVLRGVRLPEPEAIAAAPREPLPDPAILYSRNDPMSLAVQPFSAAGAPDLSEQVRKGLETSLVAAGYPVREGARAVLHVGFKEAPTGENMEFRSTGIPGMPGQNQTVAVVRLEANLVLRVAGEVAWTENVHANGEPVGSITLRNGETIEQHLAGLRAKSLPSSVRIVSLPPFIRRRDAPPPPPPCWRRLTADGVK